MAPSIVSAPLNPEPSHPEVRRQRTLPDKSYADAVEENLESSMEESSQESLSAYASKRAWKRPPKSLRRESSRSITRTRKVDEYQTKLVEETDKSYPGKHLTSVRPQPGLEDQMRQDDGGKKQPKASPTSDTQDLVSGKKPGKGWDRRIRWAPLNVPLKRRLQTLMVLMHTLSIACFLAVFFLFCAIPLTWPLLLPYVIYVLFSNGGQDGTLKRRSQFLRTLPIWSLFASYFPARLHRSQVLPSTRKYIFGYHPHGIISHGAFAAFATEALGFSQLFPGITNTLLTLDTNFRIPLYREYALAMGLASVSRKSCENLLGQGGPNGEGMGRAVTIVVGGARESLDARPGSLRLVLRRRKGFVKLAVRAGADLVPVLAFGENELYDQVRPDAHPLVHRAQLAVKRLAGFTVPLFFARGVFNYDVGLMPFRRPVNVVVGRPVKVLQANEPDPAYVELLHTLYVQELERIWNEWKGEFAKDMAGGLEIAE